MAPFLFAPSCANYAGSLESCRHRYDFRLLSRALEIVLRALRCGTQIRFAHDVVAIEDAASLVPAHGDLLQHTPRCQFLKRPA